MMRSDAPRGVAEGRKPAIRPGVFITLKVVDTERRRVHFTMRRTDTLHGLMDLYYATVPEVEYGTGRFMFDGDRVHGCQTPAELVMEDDDAIDFFPDQRLNAAASPAIFSPGELIELVVKEITGRATLCTMRRMEKLQVLMDWYHARDPAVAPRRTRFVFRGKLVRARL